MMTSSFQPVKIFLLIIVSILILPLKINSLTVNYDYSIEKVIEKGKSLKINYLNVSFDQNFNGSLKIFLDTNEVYNYQINNANNVYLENLSINIDKIYQNLIIKILDTNNTAVSTKQEKLYIYYFNTKICEIRNDKIVEEDGNLELKIRFNTEDNLEKRVYLYIDDSLEEDYSFDDNLDKYTDINVDRLGKEFICKVLIVEDNINVEVLNFSEKILVYNIDPLDFEFDDERILTVKFDDFELSNENNKVEIEINLENYEYLFEFYNRTTINDFDIDIFDNPDINDNKDKIELIKTILEEISSKEGLEVEYYVKLYLYDNKTLIDDKKVLDESYFLKYYERSGEIEFNPGGNDFNLEVIEFPQSLSIYENLNARVLVEIRDGNQFDLEVCMALNGRSYCKTVFLDEDDDEEKEKIVTFSVNINEDFEAGDYLVYFYAYDEDEDKILWKSENLEIKAPEAIKAYIENQVISGKIGEEKELTIVIENLAEKDQTVSLSLKCGENIVKRVISLKKDEIKKISVPIEIKESCDGEIITNIKNLADATTFSIIAIKEKEKKENKETQPIQKEKTIKEEFYCKVDQELIYSQEDKVSFKIMAPKETEVKIEFNKEKVIVNPYSFKMDEEEKTISIIRNTDEKIIENIKVTCKKDNKKIEKEIFVYFKEKKSIDTEKIILGSVIGVSVLVLAAIILILIK